MTDEKIKPVLVPCPFCGSAAEIFGETATFIRCSSDQCISRPEPFNDYGHRMAAIEAWNRRDSAALLQAREEGRLAGLREAAILGHRLNEALCEAKVEEKVKGRVGALLVELIELPSKAITRAAEGK